MKNMRKGHGIRSKKVAFGLILLSLMASLCSAGQIDSRADQIDRRADQTDSRADQIDRRANQTDTRDNQLDKREHLVDIRPSVPIRPTPSAKEEDTLVLGMGGASDTDRKINVTVEKVDLGDGVVLEMVWIPGGSFGMGNRLTGREAAEYVGANSTAAKNRDLIHNVQVDGFWMSKYEITNEQYMRFDSRHSTNLIAGDRFGGARGPVVYVSWFDAMAFCAFLSKKTGDAYSLPSEAQWEYACRAHNQALFSCGDSPGALEAVAWHVGNSGGATHEVGLKAPNAFGLFDMHGNALEWTRSLLAPYPYIGRDGRNDLPGKEGDPGGEGLRVLRGGSWAHDPAQCRSAAREGVEPGKMSPFFGFRVATFEIGGKRL